MTPRPRLSVCLDDLRAEARTAMDLARRLGFRAVDIGAVQGPVSPRELSATGERHLLKHLSSLGLALGSLRGPHSGRGYADAAAGDARLETMRAIVRLAGRLGVAAVSTTLGRTADQECEPRLREALSILADDASRQGVIVAIETADVGAAELAKLLAEINCPYLAACCDSGALLMAGEDPHEKVNLFAGRLALARARDAIPGSPDQPGHEVALGQGALDAPRFLADLEQGGLSGDIVLTRSSGDPQADLAIARQVLEQWLR